MWIEEVSWQRQKKNNKKMPMTGCPVLSEYNNKSISTFSWEFSAFARCNMIKEEWHGDDAIAETHQWYLCWIKWLCIKIWPTAELEKVTRCLRLSQDRWWQWWMRKIKITCAASEQENMPLLHVCMEEMSSFADGLGVFSISLLLDANYNSLSFWLFTFFGLKQC